MGVFGKKNKATPSPNPAPVSDPVRENVLSAWAIEPLLQPQSAGKAEPEKSDRKGYVFCRKCFEVIAAQDIKCSNCGAANNRN